MSSSKTRSVLQCISEYRQPAVKRKSESLCGAASAPQLNCMCCSLLTFRRPPAGADIDQRKAERGLLCAEHQIPQAVSSDVPAEQPTSFSTAALPAKVRTASFYGANKLLLVDQRVARLYASIQQRLHNLHNAPFEHFALQRQAFAWAEAHDLATDLKVFSYEHNSTGKRSFIVTTYSKFWQRYQDMLPDHRHHYEIIQEGAPCHLYFDLEYKQDLNLGIDGQAMVDRLMLLVAELLQDRFGLTMEDSWLMELESVTEHKFSRHIIMRLPGQAFAHNMHAGAFVNDICARAKKAESAEARLEVMKDDIGTVTSFVDTGVYTRNRAFRLYLSSKAGKSGILTPTCRFPNGAHSQKEIFMQSLICNVQPDTKLLKVFDDGCLSEVSHERRAANSGAHLSASTSHANIGPSPYPTLDQFIASVCNGGGVQGSIRSWLAWDDLGVMLYNIMGNRWCGNIGRPHKSNGIFIIADLQGGVWHQRCYDPDCRSYRSELMPLPPNVARAYTQKKSIEAAQTNTGSGVFGDETENDDVGMLALLEHWESSTAKQTV